MTVFCFAGPSLLPADRAAWPDIAWRDPAEAGDLLVLDAGSDDTVCLVDGYFDHRPAVRHKEILLLLSRGVRVLGAASMGALRAAEMEAAGMVGVGAIYRAYAAARLTADDEVALVHGPAEWGWRPLTLPLVDCRATVHRALRREALTTGEARSIMTAGRSLHYTDREWGPLLEQADLPAGRAEPIRRWIEANALSQKNRDAIACLEVAARGVVVAWSRPAMVWTSLVAALARSRGLNPRDLQSPAAGPSPSRAVPAAGTDDGTAPRR